MQILNVDNWTAARLSKPLKDFLRKYEKDELDHFEEKLANYTDFLDKKIRSGSTKLPGTLFFVITLLLRLYLSR